MTDFTHDWIASRAGLIATFSKPFRDMPQDKVGLSILATNDLPRALAALKAVLELHYASPAPKSWGVGAEVCGGSCGGDEFPLFSPCPTVAAIEAALRGES